MQAITFTNFKKQYDVKFKAQKGDKDFIGAGGYGSVYRGYSHQMHFEVAIKRSNTDKGLLEEVEKASKVPIHKNIARYLDGFRVDSDSGDFDVAILQYYKKGNLTQLIENETLAEKQLDSILVGILEGLQFLHEGFKDTNGKHISIIHRDLKPQNILIAEYNGVYTPLLTDFGISKLINEEDLLSSGKVENTTNAGTLVYKAPEQIQNAKVKTNLDLWAFGVMLFRILKGTLPFYSDANPSTDSFKMEVMKQITTADLNEIFAQVTDQPQKYQAVIKRCLVRDINERVQTESELIEIISEVLAKADNLSEETDIRSTLSLPILPKKEKQSVSRFDNLSLKRLGKISLVVLGCAFGLFFMIDMLSKKGKNSVKEDTVNVVPISKDSLMFRMRALNELLADSLFTLGKVQLDTMPKYFAYETFKRAVELNPALKPQVYKLYEKKINKLRNVPDVAQKYEDFADDFK